MTGVIVQPGGDVVIHLSEPTTPRAPFIGDRDEPHCWRLPSEADDAPPGAPGPPVLETLVAIGQDSDGGWVFLDLEGLGAVWLDGDRSHSHALARSLVAELALQPLSHYIDVTVVGRFDTPAVYEQGLIVAEDLDEDIVRLIERHADETSALLAREQATSTVKARLKGVARDGLFVSVLIVADGADPVLLTGVAL